jgi:hypothetical protein
MQEKVFESRRGKFHVRYYPGKEVHIDIIDGNEYIVQPTPIENLEELQDLFVTIACVLNQVYDDDNTKF